MSTLIRTIRNLWRVGLKDAAHQMQELSPLRSEISFNEFAGDTKAGTLVGLDRYGNKYFENMKEELPLRTRWIDYKDYELDPSHIEPGWHAWISYMVDKHPTQDKLLQTKTRPWELPDHRPHPTATRGAFKTYST
ncbi:NADH dehydrogenase 1 alpha subcomplex subunit N7BM [Erysiphe neolycopersici]|uniref:NADH dehydrogenase [ubiquinone] 1 alpha subcomplex subunit n=1 Tax=Erysiphe neolycopersici TaxID=212602 RepID=A0A420HWN9_9PEZI|nr:NADH dehydrogenase 1 alpha subcomplex subunit N7BM [Erysiphe neolycopersici]